MNSFYGGQPGKSFILKQIFSNKVALDADAENGIVSTVNIGDFVMISYGDPSTETYTQNKKIDADAGNGNQNATFWQKIYNESKESAFDYQFISSFVGAVPNLNATAELGSWNECDAKFTTKGDEAILKLTMPGPIEAELGEVIHDLPSEDPDVSIDPVDLKTGKQKINFSIPNAWDFGLDKIQYLKPWKAPTLEINNSEDGAKKILSFGLPEAYQFEKKNDIILPPSQEPSVECDIPSGDSKSKTIELTFHLPSSINYFYGDKLGLEQDYAGLNIADFPSGIKLYDYYVNERTGFIYQVTDVYSEGGQISFTFTAKLRSPVPTVIASEVKPYRRNEEDTGWEINVPTVDDSFDEETLTWSINFGLPSIPKLSTVNNTVASLDQASAEYEITGVDSGRFKFKTPRGSRFKAGQLVSETKLDTVVSGLAYGDFYINSDQADEASCGNIYQLGDNGLWTKYGNIKGQNGKALNIRASLTVEGSHSQDTPEYVGKLIDEQYGDITSDQIFSVLFINNDEDGLGLSYWYFKVDGVWSRATLTGSQSGFLQNTYKDQDDNRAYTVTYVNNLIAEIIETTDKERKTYNAKKIDEVIAELAGKVTALETRVAELEKALTWKTGLEGN